MVNPDGTAAQATYNANGTVNGTTSEVVVYTSAEARNAAHGL